MVSTSVRSEWPDAIWFELGEQHPEQLKTLVERQEDGVIDADTVMLGQHCDVLLGPGPTEVSRRASGYHRSSLDGPAQCQRRHGAERRDESFRLRVEPSS